MKEPATARNVVNSTGNDVVALAATNNERTRQYRFYSKILSAGEQALYNGSAPGAMPFENYVWLLWSIKESVYKYKKRIAPDLVFSPTKITVHHLETPSGNPPMAFESGRWDSAGQDNINDTGDRFYKGLIHCGSCILYSRSIIVDGIISTVVSGDKNFENTWWGVRSIDHTGYAYQSSMVRSFVVSKLKSVLSLADLQIGKSRGGYPVVLREEEQMDIPLSLAHHDRFVAYSFQLIPSH